MLILLVATALSNVGTANAHNLLMPKSRSPTAMLHYWQQEHAHAWFAVHWLGKHRWSSPNWPLAYLSHKWLLSYSQTQTRKLIWKTYPAHTLAWLCIHRYEGSWLDSGDPYWGGLQMDRSFMLHYAPSWLLRKGWANNWTPLEQMRVAEIAYEAGRGYYPWPNTARLCGLI